jgi:hypothetical protein
MKMGLKDASVDVYGDIIEESSQVIQHTKCPFGVLAEDIRTW